MGREVGGGFKREGMYVHQMPIIFKYSKSHHNIVRGLSSNFKKN